MVAADRLLMYDIKEIPGLESEPLIQEMLHLTTVPRNLAAQDSTAWCAAAVGYCLVVSGYRSTFSAAARSYLTYGAALATPKFGAITVLKRDPDPSSGHVGFWSGADDDNVWLISGNQGNAFTLAKYRAADVLGYRWPTPELKWR